MVAGRFSALRSAFSNRNYAIYMGGNSISLIGFWMQRVAVSWLAWVLSESEFWVGLIAFSEIAPLIVIAPLFGVWADRFDRKNMAIVAQVSMMVQAFVLFFLAWFNLLTIELLFLLALLEGIIQAAYQPIRLSIIPNLVEKKDLVAAAAFTAVAFNVARFVGPAVGGGVIVLFSPAMAILFNAITYLLIVTAWHFIHLPESGASARPGSFTSDIREGLDYVLDHKALLYMFILITLVSFFVRPVTFMFSAFVGAVYNAGPMTLGLLTASMGTGAVIAGLKVSMDGKAVGLVREILWMTLIAIIMLAGFALSANPYLAMAIVLVFGYSITIGSVASQTLIQNRIHDDKRGRVLSLWAAFTRGAPALGVLIIGWFSNMFGLTMPFIFASVCCFICLLLMVGKRREMREYFEIEE